MDIEENHGLTEALVGGDAVDIFIENDNDQNSNRLRKVARRIRSLPPLFFMAATLIIFIAIAFISAALIPNNATSTSSKHVLTLRDKMIQYLEQNMMPYDGPNRATLGFLNKDQIKVDGLSDGIVNQTVYYSIQAMSLYPWTDSIPQDMYFEYVVPFAVVNEPRTDYRSLFSNALRDNLKQYERSAAKNATQPVQDQIKDVVKLINTRLWATFGRNASQPIVFKASQTPRIYDPLSVIAYGYSSCTGLAITLVSALRSFGLPARMAGTPAWYGDSSKGDHR